MAGLILTISLLQCTTTRAQAPKSVRWLTFEQLEDSLAVTPKKVFIDFYTDWCTYCRKMDKVVFSNPEVINILNEKYFAVRFDAETSSEVMLGGETFINNEIDKTRNPVHQIAQLLATRGGQFTPPTLVVLDQDFTMTARYFEYLDSNHLMEALGD